MSTTNRLFEQIVSEKNLHKAWVKVKNYAKSQDLYQNHYEFETFQQNLEANILTLKYELENNHYVVTPFREIRIPRPDGRIRKILFAKPKDRIVAQAIVNVIGPLFEVDFSKNSYGNRLNLDINEHIYIFKRWQDQYIEYSAKANKFLDLPPEFYYLKADIESFYDNIDTQRLLGLISEKIEDPKVLSLIKQFLNVKIAENNAPVSGLPQGPAYSHFFANIYLNNFDIILEKKSVDFVRYVDDLLILFKGKEDAIRAKEVIESHLENLKLKFNKDKTTDLLPITNTEYLIDDIKDIKYDLNLACNRKLTKELKGKIGTIFYEVFFETPELADINELSKHITYLLPRLKELETEETLIDTIYEILRAEPLKPHTTKIVILSLIGLTSGNLDQRFINLFEDAFPHLKILFIQSLPNSEELFTPIIKLIKKFSTDSNPLVRAAAVMKLAELQINLDTSSINVLTEIFDVLVSFQQERDVKIIEIKNKYSKIKTLVPNRRIYRWLQLSTKQLIHFAIEYERQYDNLKQTQDRYFTLTPAALSLILALKLELYAFIRTLLFNWKTKEKRIEERIILLENILLPALKERPEKILISFEGNENKNVFEVSKISPHENVERVLQNFKSLGNRKFESVHLPFQDFTLTNAFLLLFCSDVSLLISNNKEPLKLLPIFGDEEFLKKSHELEILIKSLNQLEAIIESYNYSGDKSGNGVCKDLKVLFFEIVSSLNSLILGKRKAKSLVSKFITLTKKGQIQIKRLIGVKKYDFDRNHILLGFEGDSSFIKPKDFVAVDLIKDEKDFSIVNVCPSSQNLSRLEKERLKEQWAVNLLAEIQSIYKNKFSSFHKVLVATIWIVLWLVILYRVVGFSKAILGAIIAQILTYIPLEYVKFYSLHEPS
jgi:retron-type reverse transcriptase